ncbi:S-adenosyl-L-methionine-dependent methyltransferase [Fusarium oxysporum f. sp. albedinis]|nr:S-adenosyl-L-methionine-dependent methyltransferase [Fusarium oxysporum f. sp. albedinis]
MAEPTINAEPDLVPDEQSDEEHDSSMGLYNLPNDDVEKERLDLQHNLFILMLDNKLGLAPPNDPNSKAKRVLDVGTGTGIWAIDYADEHPEAKVIGVDLSPIQPDFVPPNVEFFIDDIEEPWNFSEPFDYVHMRLITFLSNLVPGGYVELLEIDLFAHSDDNTLTEDHHLSKLIHLLDEASTKIGRPFQDNKKNKDILRDAGFVDIVETVFKWPTNRWPLDKRYKEIGEWNNLNMDSFKGLEALSMAALTRVLGWSQEEVTVFLAKVRRDLNDRTIHAYFGRYSTYGRRPLD